MFTFYRWLSMRGNSFLVCSACAEIGSAYAQHAIKSFLRMLSIRMQYFSKMTQKSLNVMQISPIKNQNFEKPSKNLSDRTKVKILKKKNLLDISQKIFGSAYAQSPRTSKFWRKSKEKKRNFFRKFMKGI